MAEIKVVTKFDVGNQVFFFQRTKETSVPICGNVVGVLPVIGDTWRPESYVLHVKGSEVSWVVPVGRIYQSACDLILACQQEGFSRGVEFVADAEVGTIAHKPEAKNGDKK